MIEQPVFVETLTDEELSVLAPPGGPALNPYLDELPAAEQAVARRTAYRGLLSRGIVDPPTATALAAAATDPDGAVELMTRRDVRSLVTLREQARWVVAAARTTSSGRDYWYGYVVDEILLLEEVSEDGMHRFALARTEQLPELVVTATVHPDSGDAVPEAVPLPMASDGWEQPTATLERLAEASVRVDLVVRRLGERVVGPASLFTGPRGRWVIEDPDGLTALAQPMTVERVREQVRAWVRPALPMVGSHVRPLSGPVLGVGEPVAGPVDRRADGVPDLRAVVVDEVAQRPGAVPEYGGTGDPEADRPEAERTGGQRRAGPAGAGQTEPAGWPNPARRRTRRR